MVSGNLVPGSVRHFVFTDAYPVLTLSGLTYPRDTERNIPTNSASISPPVPQNVERSFCFCFSHFDSFR